ncbi:MAG: hypothetical protein GY778_22130 [bacterium]|nr:hypothetical protein [bacterium]
MDAVAGIPGLSPKLEMPVQPVILSGDNILHNINVSNSNIGVLNTGHIGAVDSAIGFLSQYGESDGAAAIKSLTEAVIRNEKVANETKEEIIELLGVIATEATSPPERRKSKAIAPVIDRVATIFKGLGDLASIWTQYAPAISAMFG